MGTVAHCLLSSIFQTYFRVNMVVAVVNKRKKRQKGIRSGRKNINLGLSEGFSFFMTGFSSENELEAEAKKLVVREGDSRDHHRLFGAVVFNENIKGSHLLSFSKL